MLPFVLIPQDHLNNSKAGLTGAAYFAVNVLTVATIWWQVISRADTVEGISTVDSTDSIVSTWV